MICMLKQMLGSKTIGHIRSETCIYQTWTCIPQADVFIKINKTTHNTTQCGYSLTISSTEQRWGFFPSFFAINATRV